MIEVEIKAKVENEDKLKKKLRELGAEKKATVFEEDIYFQHPSRDFAESDEALRLRRSIEKTKESAKKLGERFFLTYKGKKIDKKTKTREEISVEVNNLEKAEKILERLGFKEVARIKKSRELYELGEYLISIDSVENLGKFAEIEKKSENYSVEEMLSFMKKLGLKESIRESYLELLLNLLK